MYPHCFGGLRQLDLQMQCVVKRLMEMSHEDQTLQLRKSHATQVKVRCLDLFGTVISKMCYLIGAVVVITCYIQGPLYNSQYFAMLDPLDPLPHKAA